MKFKVQKHGDKLYEQIDLEKTNLTQVERSNLELKRISYEQLKVVAKP